MGTSAITLWLQFLRRLSVGVLLLYVCVILCVGGTRSARPLWYALSALWLVSLAAIAIASRHEGPARKAWRIWRGLDIAATNVALTLFLAELTLQGWAAAGG